MVKIKDVKVNLGFMSVTFVEDELEDALKDFVEEMRNITGELGQLEIKALDKIMNTDKELSVTDIFPDFTRGSLEHETLRKLRDAQFIRPLQGGRWKSDKTLMKKPFGVLMWKKIGKEKLFQGKS